MGEGNNTIKSAPPKGGRKTISDIEKDEAALVTLDSLIEADEASPAQIKQRAEIAERIRKKKEGKGEGTRALDG